MQVSPPGFHVMYLPFAEDIRKIHHECASKGLLRPLFCLHGDDNILSLFSSYN